MKVEHAQDNVQGSQGLEQTTTFKINTTAHAFKILSSGLYSDKIGAVLREIGCNAMDAHIEVGLRDTPFIVKLPNDNDDQFYVQDFGPGLSHEDLLNLYSTYFASTKQTSNDFTGAFGLGSKSPFSYTKSISVVSCHGGKKRTYASYINNKSQPVTSLLTEEDVSPDWPTGMRIGFSVKPNDYSEFREKAQNIYGWFRVTPTILGSTPVKKFAPRRSNGNIHEYDGLRGLHVLMGNVLYPVNRQELGLENPGYSWEHKSARVPRNYASNLESHVIQVGIGDVEVAASREQLQYSEQTLKYLHDAFDKVVVEMAKDIRDLASKALQARKWETYAEARRLVKTMGCTHSSIGLILRACKVCSEAEAGAIGKLFSSGLVPFPKATGTHAKVRLVVPGGHRSKNGVRIHYITDGNGAFGETVHLNRDEDTALLVSSDHEAVARAAQHLRNGGPAQIVVVTTDRKLKHTPGQLADEARSLQDHFGELPALDIDDLPAAPPKVQKPGGNRRSKKWTPALPATTEFQIYDFAKGGNRTDTLHGVTSLAFAGVRRTSAWGRDSTAYRLFRTEAAKDDSYMDAATWRYRVNENYKELYSALHKLVPDMPSSYAVLSTKEIKESCVELLGWKPIRAVIAEHLVRQEMIDALRSLRTSSRPPVPTRSWNTRYGWISELCISMTHEKQETPQWLIDRLDEAGLWSYVQSTAGESQNRKTRAVNATLQTYQQMCSELGVKCPIETGKIEDAITLEAVDGAFIKRFPLSEVVDLGVAIKHPRGREVIEHVLDNEVKA